MLITKRTSITTSIGNQFADRKHQVHLVCASQAVSATRARDQRQPRHQSRPPSKGSRRAAHRSKRRRSCSGIASGACGGNGACAAATSGGNCHSVHRYTQTSPAARPSAADRPAGRRRRWPAGRARRRPGSRRPPDCSMTTTFCIAAGRGTDRRGEILRRTRPAPAGSEKSTTKRRQPSVLPGPDSVRDTRSMPGTLGASQPQVNR